MQETLKWYVKRKEKLYGPFSLAKMKSFINEGRVRPSTQVCRGKAFPLGPAKKDDVLSDLFPQDDPGLDSPSPKVAVREPKPGATISIQKATRSRELSEKPKPMSAAIEPIEPKPQTRPKTLEEREPIQAVDQKTEKVIRRQKRETTPNVTPPQRDPKPEPNERPLDQKPKANKTSPTKNLVLFVIIFGGLLAATYGLITFESPAKTAVIETLEHNSEIRTQLKHPPLPPVWNFWKDSVINHLNFTKNDIQDQRETDIQQPRDLAPLHLPDDVLKATSSHLSYIQTGGYYVTYLFDTDGFVLGVAVSHANFQRINVAYYQPDKLGEEVEVTISNQVTTWETPVLDDFRGQLIWGPDGTLACLLVVEG